MKSTPLFQLSARFKLGDWIRGMLLQCKECNCLFLGNRDAQYCSLDCKQKHYLERKASDRSIHPS